MFFPPPEKQPRPKTKGHIDFQLLHALGCKACPLARIHNNCPDMPPSGVERPLVYIIGEAPGREEDEEGVQFVGQSGELLRARLEEEFPEFEDRLRWNNTVRTRPWEDKVITTWNGSKKEIQANRTPTAVEVECCRPSVMKDIEQAKPKAIFGFGNIPLQMLTGFSGIGAFRGRRLPIKVGEHVCWYYPMLHPAGLLRQGKRGRRDDRGRPMFQDPVPTDSRMPSEQERMFVYDLRKAFGEIEDLPEAEILSAKKILSNFTLITECTDAALDLIERELKWYEDQPVVGIDYETHSDEQGEKNERFSRPYGHGARILSIAVATKERGLAFGYRHPGAEWTKKQRQRLKAIWIRFLIKCRAIKAVHNLQFEFEWTGYFFDKSLIRTGTWECTLSQANTIDERGFGTQPGPMTLEFLMLQYFGINVKKLAGVNRGGLIKVPLPNVLEYNCMDARSHCMLHDKQVAIIEDEGLANAHKYMLRRVPAVVLSQLKGMPVSQLIARALDHKYEKRVEDTLAQIAKHKHAKLFKLKTALDFNPFAPEDAILLFGKYLDRPEVHVEVKAKEKARELEAERDYNKEIEDKDTKERATKAVLRSIPGTLPKLIITARESRHRRSSYIAKMLPDTKGTALWRDGLLHPSFNTWKARTGRMSADAPPVQQWPKRDSEAREVRKPVAAPKGKKIIAVDYGQIEARVIAMYTKDPKFVKALWDDYDIHAEWAHRVASRIPERIGGREFLKDKAVMKTFRTDIKNQWTFPLVFGATAPSVTEYLGLDPDEASDLRRVKNLIDEFWEEFEEIHKWQKGQMQFYRDHGYVETFTGRRRRGPLSPNKVYNSPVQGVTAELVMDAFCRLSETGDEVLQAELNIHDDLTFLRVPEKQVDKYMERILDIMVQPPFDFINVPITVEAAVGDNWLEMEEVGTFSSHKWNPEYHKNRRPDFIKMSDLRALAA